MAGGGMGGGRMGGGRRHLEDIVEGKLFLGGIEQDMSQEQLSNYCGGWYAPLEGCCVEDAGKFCVGADDTHARRCVCLAQQRRSKYMFSQAYLQGSDYRCFCISQGVWLCDVR